MNVAVFFGGKSCEHNISVATGVMVANSIKSNAHNVFCVYIDKDGKWWSDTKLFDINTFKKTPISAKRVYIKGGEPYLYFSAIRKIRIDCAVLCNHGKNGEDGALQGTLQLSNVPYTGSDVLGSAIGMDKITMKRLFRSSKIPTVPFVVAYKFQSLNQIADRVEHKLIYPVIVKPSNLGSSIGIEIAHDRNQLMYALNIAFEWDESVVIERALTDFTELNCAVLGDRENCITGVIERPVSAGEFLSYQDKYHSGLKTTLSDRIANLDPPLDAKIRGLTKRAFDVCSASGVARMDFMLDNSTGTLYANEINTIPGSLSTYLFPDISAEDLVEKLITLAVKRHSSRDLLRYTYEDSSFSRKYK